MKWITHQSVAVMAAFALHQPLASLAAVWAGSVFPDVLDQKRAAFSFSRQRAFNQSHRRTSHWFGWWLTLWVFAHAGCLGPVPDTLLAGFAFGAFTHVFLDMCTTKGVPVLPFGGRRFSLKLCRTGSFAEYAFLAVCAALFWLTQRQALLSLDLPLF